MPAPSRLDSIVALTVLLCLAAFPPAEAAEAVEERPPRVASPWEDPPGDTFNDGFYELLKTSVRLTEEEIVIELDFDGPISSPDGFDLGLQGTLELDLDRDPATGKEPNADFYRPEGTPGATGMGGDAYVDLFSYRNDDGRADLIADGFLVDRVPVSYEPTRLVAVIDASLLGHPAALDAAVIVGTIFEASDLAPNDGAISAFVDPVTLLHDGRFEVRSSWRDFEGDSGFGREVTSSEDSAILYFFGPSNWEILAKVLEGCGINGHWWVFFSGSTNVEFELEVLDTWTDAVQTYANPLGRTAVTVTDTAAFVCD